MTDPVLHEATIIDTLDCRCTVDNAARLQAGALMSLVDAYDRKLGREEFIALAGASLMLHTQIGKLFMIQSVVENDAMGTLDSDMLARCVHGVTKLAETAHGELHRLMDRVVMCPTSQHRVH